MILQLAVSHLALPIHLVGLLFINLLLNLGFLLMREDILCGLDVGQVALSLLGIVSKLDLCFHVHLVEELVTNIILLVRNSLGFLLDKLFRLLRTEMRLIILPIDLFLEGPALLVLIHLRRDKFEILNVVFSLELQVMRCNHVGLVLLPAKLLAFVLTVFLDAFALGLEAIVGQGISLRLILHKLITLAVGVVKDFERALGTHEVRVGGGVVAGTDLLTVQCLTNDGADIIFLP